MHVKLLRHTTTVAIIFSLLVVILGAYTRLTDAGLGCPDWPGCYGHMILPSAQGALNKAQQHYPAIPIETSKAWTEMVHRYAAGVLATLIFFIGIYSIRLRQRGYKISWQLPLLLMALVIFQAALGMWTVTWKLLPIVVMGHLLGGVLLFSSLTCLRMQWANFLTNGLSRWRLWIALGLGIVFCQIALGGWVSSNYAGISCIGFPQCNGQWLPTLKLAQGFNLVSPVGENYQGGLLESDIRVTIQFIHRLGAIFTAVYVLALSFALLLKCPYKMLRWLAGMAIFLVLVQFALGVLNVIYLLPLSVALAHNGIAAILLATLASMLSLSQKTAWKAHNAL